MKLLPKKNIFIVDDDADDRQIILEAFLENNSIIDYVFIETGDLLMDILQKREAENLPSLILLDLNMPGMMGLHVLKKIRENKYFAHIPVIILTTSTIAQDETSSYKLGANCFLRKPDSFKELCEIAASVLRLWFPQKKVVNDD
jgi:CheY-like chemotaxis protein